MPLDKTKINVRLSKKLESKVRLLIFLKKKTFRKVWLEQSTHHFISTNVYTLHTDYVVTVLTVMLHLSYIMTTSPSGELISFCVCPVMYDRSFHYIKRVEQKERHGCGGIDDTRHPRAERHIGIHSHNSVTYVTNLITSIQLNASLSRRSIYRLVCRRLSSVFLQTVKVKIVTLTFVVFNF